MNKTRPYISEDEEGRRFLVIGALEYELGNRGEANLDGRGVPTIRMDQVPEGVCFLLNYKFMLISIPLFLLDSRNVGIALRDEDGNPFDDYEPHPFMEFWRGLPTFVEECIEDHTGIRFAVVKISGETLEATIDKIKALIDGFWKRHQAVYDDLNGQDHDPQEQ